MFLSAIAVLSSGTFISSVLGAARLPHFSSQHLHGFVCGPLEAIWCPERWTLPVDPSELERTAVQSFVVPEPFPQ
jgi:hypothetical protein